MHPSPFLLGCGVNPPTTFSKSGGLTRPQLLEGGCWERGGDFFQEGCDFHIKNKLKSEIFNDKKVYKQSADWLILTSPRDGRPVDHVCLGNQKLDKVKSFVYLGDQTSNGGWNVTSPLKLNTQFKRTLDT